MEIFTFYHSKMIKFDEQIISYWNPFQLQEDKVRLILYFIFSIPSAFIYSRIQSQFYKLIYSIIFGIIFTLFLAKEWFIFINFIIIVIFFVVHIPSKNRLISVSIVSFIALFYVHIYRQFFDYLSWKIDFSVIQMTITCRFIYYAVDCGDRKLTWNNFFIFYSYVLTFYSIMIGPVPFINYENSLSQPQTKYNKLKQYKAICSNFIKAFIFCAGEVFIRPYFDFDWYTTQQWANLNLLEKNLLQGIIGLVARFKYFAGFKFAQAALDASGITYNEDTDEFNLFSTCDYKYEIEVSAVQKTGKWNTMVQNWLKYCFFDKFSKQINIQTAYYLTYGISAIWHGFYFGYYQTFFWWALINQNCKYAYRAKDKFNKIPLIIKQIIGYVYCTFTMNQIAMTMALLDWEKGLQFNNSMYWSAQIAILIVFFFFNLTQFGQQKRIK